MDSQSLICKVVMERVPTKSRWEATRWQVADVSVDEGTGNIERQSLPGDVLRVTHPGVVLNMFRDEAEGYFLNVGSPEPSIFVVWRWNADETEAIPYMLTLSYNEAARLMDAQEKVERVPMPEPLLAALSQWVETNYDPPKKKQRIRPKSFESKEGRYKSGM
jgi:Protein of unknown function (DUF3305)